MEKPVPRSRAAKKRQAQFAAKYAKYMAEANSVVLTVLVWGPSPAKDTPAARKRLEIRNELALLGHIPILSEDIPAAPSGLSEKSKELAQAKAADLIIILNENAPGALTEFHDFCEHPDIASKLLLLIPNDYKMGYSANGAVADFEAAFGLVYWYSERDLEICNVCRRAKMFTEARRNILYGRTKK
jgi:hypothetical protein